MLLDKRKCSKVYWRKKWEVFSLNIVTQKPGKWTNIPICIMFRGVGSKFVIIGTCRKNTVLKVDSIWNQLEKRCASIGNIKSNRCELLALKNLIIIIFQILDTEFDWKAQWRHWANSLNLNCVRLRLYYHKSTSHLYINLFADPNAKAMQPM